MKIEMNKKYKTKDGRAVRIYAVDGIGRYSVHGAIDVGDGYSVRTWTYDGYRYSDEEEDCGDLVEVKEDWEVLVEHFENKGKPVFIVFNNEVCLCADMKQCEYSREHCKLLLAIRDEGYHSNIRKEKIKIATLEDCKKYILEG